MKLSTLWSKSQLDFVVWENLSESITRGENHERRKWHFTNFTGEPKQSFLPQFDLSLLISIVSNKKKCTLMDDSTYASRKSSLRAFIWHLLAQVLCHPWVYNFVKTIEISRLSQMGIAPDPLDYQLHVVAFLLFTSLFTSLFISLIKDWNGHSRSLVLCSVTHLCVVFEVCVWIIVRLEDLNMDHHKISITYKKMYLLLFDRIHDAMCLNKMSRTSSRNIGPQHQKYSSIFNCTHGVLFIPVFT